MKSEISRREFVKAAGMGVAALATRKITFGTEDSKNAPNIIFILTDDQRYDQMGCAGHPWVRTPNIDRLAKEGVLFSNAFATTALCSPSRAGFLTGCYAHTNGVLHNERCDPDANLATFPQLLQKAGYETAFIGKWHMERTDKPRKGFDHWVSFTGQGNYYGNDLNVDGKTIKTDNYITDELTEYALQFIKKDRKKPFMLYLSHKAIHDPQEPAKRHEKLYDGTEMKLNLDPNDNLSTKPQWPTKVREGWEKKMLNRMQCLAAVDESIGRILETLENMKILDKTVIIFAGDNGHLNGEHNLWDKRIPYEPSIRIPLIMRYPALAKGGSRCEQMVLNIDLAPTLLELAGQPIPATVQGQSWLKTLNGQPGRESFLYEHFLDETDKYKRPTVLAVRTMDWKYTVYPFPDKTSRKFLTAELYDLKNDPKELNNLINNPNYAEVAEKMVKEFEKLKIQTAFKFP